MNQPCSAREIRRSLCALVLLGLLLGVQGTAGADPPDAAKARQAEEKSQARPAGDDPIEQFRKANEELHKAQASLEKAQEQLRKAAKDAEGKARAELQQARDEAVGAMQTAQGELRRIAQTMHEQHKAARAQVREGIDKAQELAREQRRALSQNELWQRLRKKLGETTTLTAPVREELRLHARRTARLQRVQTLAREAGDQQALKRVQALLEREQARHARWMDALDAKDAQGKAGQP